MHKGDDMGIWNVMLQNLKTPPTSSPGKAASAKARSSRAIGASANRWVVLAAAGTFNALVGAVYVWSIFLFVPFEHVWMGSSATAFAYSLYIVSECCAGFLAGWLQNRMKPEILSLCGGCSFAAGGSSRASRMPSPVVYDLQHHGSASEAASSITYRSPRQRRGSPTNEGSQTASASAPPGFLPSSLPPASSPPWASASFHICGIIFAVGVVVASRFLAAPQGWTPKNWIRGDRSPYKKTGSPRFKCSRAHGVPYVAALRRGSKRWYDGHRPCGRH